MKRPIIGITTDGDRAEYQSYADAISVAGGEPLFLDPRPATHEALAEDLRRINGLLLTGGLDVHPDYYPSRNEPGDEKLGAEELIATYRMKCDPGRDAYEIPLARMAYDARLPILGICRGFQLFNVALGGSLIKDIRTGRKHWAYREEEKEEGKPGESRKHLATIASDSRLAAILGDCPLLVNSRHHQGITENEKSEHLKAVAFAPDAIVEAVESREHPWALAVQWHPERRVDSYIYEPSMALFAAFVSAARERRVAPSPAQ